MGSLACIRSPLVSLPLSCIRPSAQSSHAALGCCTSVARRRSRGWNLKQLKYHPPGQQPPRLKATNTMCLLRQKFHSSPFHKTLLKTSCETQSQAPEAQKQLFAASTANNLSQANASSDLWSKVDTWVVFSDLHFSRRTSDTCLQVLQAVHAEACARKGGIIFLGDFWHSRGALPVELLNMVVNELRIWSCPAIFIPGNHDQVNFGGSAHALTVIGAINHQIKVLDEPTEFLGALWLPYRRDHNLIKQALEQHSAVKAIFAHVDVVGAFMNESYQALEGVHPSLFPQNIPVYTGHYHKPHTVQNTLIQYIGSPYQVSSSERDQAKRLLLLTNNWENLGDVTIDVGSRHFVISQPEHTCFGKLEGLRTGDRVRLQLSTSTLEESVQSNLESLQRRGIEVEISYPLVSSRPRIEQAEHSDVLGLFDLYVEKVGMSSEAATSGKSMLRNLGLPAHLIQRSQVHFSLQDVEIEGFGPYLETVKYPLSKRGVCVICGTNLDSIGADSNGTGKSTLVMAPLWALTGSTDPRPGALKGLTSSDVVNQKAKVARVRLEGTVNGKPFAIERSTGRKSSLKFYYDGEDCTCQELKLTQEKIDNLIDTSALERIAFHGQYGLGGLLEASDKDFKEELSHIVPMEVWLNAKEKTLMDMRRSETKCEHNAGELSQLDDQQKLLKRKVEESKQRLQEWDNSRARQQESLTMGIQVAQDSLQRVAVMCKNYFQSIKESVCSWQSLAKKLDHSLSAEMSIWQSNCSTKNKEILHLEYAGFLKRVAEFSVEVRNARAFLSEKEMNLISSRKTLLDMEVCDNCLQPVDKTISSKRLLQLEHEVAEQKKSLEALLVEHEVAKQKLQEMDLAINEQALKEETANKKHKANMSSLQVNVGIVRDTLASAQAILRSSKQFFESGLTADAFSSEESHGVASIVKVDPDEFMSTDILKEKAHDFQELISQLDTEMEKVRALNNKVLQLKADIHMASQTENPFMEESKTLLNWLNEVEVEIEKKVRLQGTLRQQIGWLKELDEAFGHKGIQSYILEVALLEIQERTSNYLEVLSGGTLGLLLRPSKELKKSKASVERIDKIAVVRLANGTTEHRSIRQLSGGERRRQALALALGYAEFVSQRTGLTCDFMVLDEVLQHLDSEGKARVAAVLRGLPQHTILVVSQTHSDLADAFDVIDMVIKQNDTATIQIASGGYDT